MTTSADHLKESEVDERFAQLFDDIAARSARVGVIGLGYVGLPVAVTFAEVGYRVVGIDLREHKVNLLEQGRSHLRDVPDERIAPLRESGHLRASTSFEPLREADALVICVPTPLEQGTPDLSRVIFAGESLAKVLRPGALVVLESTTYPGTTEEILQPLLEAEDLRGGRDFLLAYSPERIDPGNPNFDFSDIPKVVGGIDELSTNAAALLYQQAVPKVVSVSGPREAEMAKLIENTFRHVNIALVNELALYSEELGVDIWEAIAAASTKPFGYLPLWPSPGWGGHCIPLDPAYLSWKVKASRSHEIRFVELAQELNSEMPRHVVDRCSLLLNDRSKAVRGSRVLGVGIAYKAGTEDTRESAAVKILDALHRRGAEVAYHDPLVPSIQIGDRPFESAELTKEVLRAQDLVVIFTPQHGVDFGVIAKEAGQVFDCCNALGRKGGNIVRL
jgi:UDP-N-acetyl-D-glucosamine dehydrogenase